MPLYAADYSALHVEDSGTADGPIDIHIDVPAVNYKEMRAGSEPNLRAHS